MQAVIAAGDHRLRARGGEALPLADARSGVRAIAYPATNIHDTYDHQLGQEWGPVFPSGARTPLNTKRTCAGGSTTTTQPYAAAIYHRTLHVIEGSRQGASTQNQRGGRKAFENASQ
jgi:hypothetical protein